QAVVKAHRYAGYQRGVGQCYLLNFLAKHDRPESQSGSLEVENSQRAPALFSGLTLSGTTRRTIPGNASCSRRSRQALPACVLRSDRQPVWWAPSASSARATIPPTVPSELPHRGRRPESESASSP